MALLAALAALIAFSGYWYFAGDALQPQKPGVIASVSMIVAPPLALLIWHFVTLPLRAALLSASRVIIWVVPTLCATVLGYPNGLIGLPLTYFAGCYLFACCSSSVRAMLLAIPLLLFFLLCLLCLSTPIPILFIIFMLFDNSYVELSPDGH